MRVLVVLASCLGTFVALGLAACELDDTIDFVSVCYNDAGYEVPCCGPLGKEFACAPEAGDEAADGGEEEADAGDEDGGPDASACPGACILPGGGGFEHLPSFVWMGKETASPPFLPGGEPLQSWVDVTFAEPTCPSCSCAKPAAACVMPGTWNATAAVCQPGSPANVTPFDAPAGWDGTCTAANSIAAGLVCDGVPCVQSLTVEPPSVTPCVSQPAMPPEGQPLPPPVRTKVIEYPAAGHGACDDLTECIGKTPPGYRLCFVAHGPDASRSCRKGWSDRHTGWEVAEEQRACSPCTCGEPQGGDCKVRVQVYADEACGDLSGTLILSSSEAAKCTDLMSGTALGSKTAEPLVQEPGVCEPGVSEVMGAPQTDSPVTFCCQPELVPPP